MLTDSTFFFFLKASLNVALVRTLVVGIQFHSQVGVFFEGLLIAKVEQVIELKFIHIFLGTQGSNHPTPHTLT